MQKGLVWSRGGGGGEGKHFSKTFSILYMLNSKNRVFNPYFSIGTCPMRKRLLWISRGLNPTIFFIEKISFSLNFSLVIFMGNPSLRLSEVLYDKRDDFDFESVNFPFLDGDVPRSTFYGVYISQLIRFARASSNVADFNTRNKCKLRIS